MIYRKQLVSCAGCFLEIVPMIVGEVERVRFQDVG